MKFKVHLYQDNIYEVIDEETYYDSYRNLFRGTLADCEAWIRLKERDMI